MTSGSTTNCWLVGWFTCERPSSRKLAFNLPPLYVRMVQCGREPYNISLVILHVAHVEQYNDRLIACSLEI